MILDKIFNGMEGVEVYQDNIYVHGHSREEHDARLQDVRSWLKKRKLEINLEKCNFAKQELNVLGTIVSFNKLRPDPKKVEGIRLLRQCPKFDHS